MIYEITILEPEQNTIKETKEVRAIIEKWGAIRTAQDDGIKRLCYPITLKGVEHNYARYVYYIVSINAGDESKLAGELVRDDRVLRYLIVKSRNQADSDFIIHERKPVEIYSDLDGNIVEENDQIQSEYVVRYNITGDRFNPTWEDQADFETLEEAEKFLAECRSKENGKQ